METIYDDIADAKALIIHVANSGLSTDKYDLKRACEIIDSQSEESLINLANSAECINGEKISGTFYSVLFIVWPWLKALDFYNTNTSLAGIRLREYKVALRNAKKEIEERDKIIEIRKKKQEEYCVAWQDADLKWQIAEREKIEAQQEILTLKAKLYNLMTAGT